MSAALVLAAAVAASSASAVAVASAPAGVPFDEANYPAKRMAALRRAEPCPPKGPALKDLRFSNEMRWNGDVRPTSPARMDTLKAWTEEIGDPGSAPKYASEATFSEGRRLEWVSVPEGLLAYLQMDLQAGDRVRLFLVFTGCAEGGPVWAVDEYEVPKQLPFEEGDELIRTLPPVDGEDAGVLGPRQARVLERGDDARPLGAALEEGPRVAVDGQHA
jgi:hypothetical protein